MYGLCLCRLRWDVQTIPSVGGKKKGCKCKEAPDLELKAALSASASPAASGLVGHRLCRCAMLQLEKLTASFLIELLPGS